MLCFLFPLRKGDWYDWAWCGEFGDFVALDFLILVWDV